MNQKIVCPACSLLCDDVVADENLSNACPKGRAFLSAIPSAPSQQCFVDKQPVHADAALQQAKEILLGATAPLICGLNQWSTQGQYWAWKIATQVCGTIDTALSFKGRGSTFALQRIGKVTATLGEIRERSNLIVFWYCDPTESHPRLLERLQTAERDTHVVVVDEQESQFSQTADTFIQLPANSAGHFLSETISLLRGSTGNARLTSEPSSIQLVELLRQSQYGCLFFGTSDESSQFDLTTDLLHQLTRELNNHTRFVSLKLRKDFNGQSAENVLGSCSGFPFAVNLNRRQTPRFGGKEYSAERTLERNGCDVVLLGTGPDTAAELKAIPKSALANLKNSQLITVGPQPLPNSSVHLASTFSELDFRGDICRLDDVIFPLVPLNSKNNSNSPTMLQQLAVGLSE